MSDFEFNPVKEALGQLLEYTGLAGHRILDDGPSPIKSSSEGIYSGKNYSARERLSCQLACFAGATTVAIATGVAAQRGWIAPDDQSLHNIIQNLFK